MVFVWMLRVLFITCFEYTLCEFFFICFWVILIMWVLQVVHICV